MSLAPGTKLGPYEVLAPLGAGGMGEVWRARDTRLDRDVAIKVIPDALTSDPKALHRFESEAKAVAALSHPNILSLFDVGESGGVHYAVTELLEGETLRALVTRGPVPLKRALAIAHEIAEGLAAAHEKGIVHRDLKPENVFLTKDGHAKVLDFGLARHEPTFRNAGDTHSPTLSAFTEAGAVMGTYAYMSPEQASGKAVDHRSDQFSLGTVLYEMLAGKRPFCGETAAETLTAIIREEPETLGKVAPSVPAPVRRIVERLLAKEPGGRYDSTRDLARDVESWRSVGPDDARPARGRPAHLLVVGAVGAVVVVVLAAFAGAYLAGRSRNAVPGPGTSPAGSTRRIVVLPLENLGSADDSYFAAGMTEEITSRLASVRSLAVVSRTTATQYDRRGKTLVQIARDLGVDFVLAGSVRWDRSGGGPGRVRITPQLVRAADDTQLWSERYDRQLADVFAVQGEVADGVVRALDLTLAPAESTAVRTVPTRDLPAYDLYLRALDLDRESTKKSAREEQIRLVGAAVERDPTFVEALALLVKARISYYYYFDRRPAELERARVEAERAVALRPDSAEAHWGLGYFNYRGRRDYPAALAEFRRALALKPSETRLRAAVSFVLRRQGKMEEAEAEQKKALDGDPRNASFLLNLGETQLLRRDYAEAARSFSLATSFDPTEATAHCRLAWTHVLWHGDVPAARGVLDRASAIPGLEDPFGMAVHFGFREAMLARDGNRALAHLDASRLDAVDDAERSYVPLSLLRAEALAFLRRAGPARESFEAARRDLEARVAGRPDDERLHSSLGIALAGLGLRAEAVREGERGVELMPPARDAYLAPERIEDLARIHAMVGNREAAVELLADLLSRSSWMSVPLLRLDPRWDPLRADPRFVALLATHEVKP